MLSVLPTFTAATGAVLAAAAWAAEVRRPGAFRRPHAAMIVAWAVLSTAGHLVLVTSAPSGAPWPPATAPAVFLAAAAVASVGIVGVVRRMLTGGAGQALAEGLLVGSSAVTTVWVLLDPVGGPSVARVTGLVLAVVTASLLVLVLRLPLAAGGRALPGGHRKRLAAAAVALGALTCAGLLLTARQRFGPYGAGFAAIGYVAVALVPHVGESPARVGRRPTYAAMFLPYAVTTVAVLAVGLQVARGHAGLLTGVLVSVVAGSLVAVQSFAMRSGAALLTDLEVARQRLEALVENAQDVLLGIDVGCRVVAANAAVQRLLVRAPQHLEGRDVAEIAVLDDRPAVRSAVLDVVRGRRATASVELRIAGPGTGTAEMRLRGVEGGAVAVLSDVTDAVLLREKLQELASHDRMTGLVNRGVVLDTVTSWLAGGAPVSVLYCDLDGYKAVNDRFGHLAGDDVLVEVARRLETAVRGMPAEEALLGRIGGDEFVVALRGVSGAAAAAAGKRLVAALRPNFLVGDRTVRLGISIGISGTDDAEPLPAQQGVPGPPLESGAAAELLHRGDLAMFTAKATGRAKIARWDPDMSQRALRRVDIAIGLRQALDTGRLALAYQPLVRLSDGAVVGVEALLRVGNGDDGPGALSRLSGFVSPAELVEVAEDTGEIIEMGRWVLRQASHRCALWQALGHQLFVAVNMSVRQLSEDGFVRSVRRALTESGLPADSLVVEITEGQLVGEEDPVRDVIEELRGDGVRFVIDDFGTGYSSLSYLKTMPVRAIKLDRTLLDGVGSDPRATTLARSVVGVARALGLEVVAEGLESLEVARLMRDLGAWAGQGFALHPPLPEEELLQVLSGAPFDLADGPRVIDLRDPVPVVVPHVATDAAAGDRQDHVVGDRADAAAGDRQDHVGGDRPGDPAATAPFTGGIPLAAHGPVGEAPRVTGDGSGVAGVVLPTSGVSDDETRRSVD